MSAFPSTQIPGLIESTPPAVRREAADSIMEASRAVTEPGAVRSRAVPRATIGELNDLDFEQFKQRYHETQIDDRGPVTRALDMLDAPRAFVADMLAPGVRERLAREGRTEAGRGVVVHGSDILESMGIENQIARGLGGFVLDVAMDPLTYLGPAGWGLRVTSKTGRALEIGRNGARALKAASKAAAAGRLIRDAETAELIAKAGFTPERINQLRTEFQALAADGRAPARSAAKFIQSKIRQEILGAPDPSKFSRALRPLGGELEYHAPEPGLLARAHDSTTASSVIGATPAGELAVNLAERDATLAAQKWVAKYGKAAKGGPLAVGIQLGTGGSQIMHVPFTQIGLSVPAFTGAGRAAETAQVVARAGQAVIDRNSEVGEHLVTSMRLVGEIQSATEAARAAAQKAAEFDLRATRDSAEIGDALRVGPPKPTLEDLHGAGNRAKGASGEQVDLPLPSEQNPETLTQSTDEALGTPGTTPAPGLAPLPEPREYDRAPVGDEHLHQLHERDVITQHLTVRMSELADKLAELRAHVAGLDPTDMERWAKNPTQAAAEQLASAKLMGIAETQARDIQALSEQVAGKYTEADKSLRSVFQDERLGMARQKLDEVIGNHAPLRRSEVGTRMYEQILDSFKGLKVADPEKNADLAWGALASEAYQYANEHHVPVERYLADHFDEIAVRYGEDLPLNFDTAEPGAGGPAWTGPGPDPHHMQPPLENLGVQSKTGASDGAAADTEREVADSHTEGSPSDAGDGAGGSGAGAGGDASSRPGGIRKAGRSEFTFRDIETRLRDASRRLGNDENAGDIAINTHDQFAYDKDQVPFSSSFAGKLPAEVKDALEGKKNLLRYIRTNVPGGRGEDALSDLGVDKWVEMLHGFASGEAGDLDRALEAGRGAKNHDPEAHFLAWLYDNRPTGKDRPKWNVIDNPRELPDGTRLEIFGTPFEVVKDEGEPFSHLVEQVNTDDEWASPASFILDALDSIPADRGTVKLPGHDILYQHKEQARDLFGRPVTEKLTGEQKMLPIESKLPEGFEVRRPGESDEEYRLRMKFKKAVENTPSLFDSKSGTVRGIVDFLPDNKARVMLRDGAKLDTLLHEFGHVTLRRLHGQAAADADKAILDLLKKQFPRDPGKWAVRDASGALSVPAQEVFAEGVTAYFASGYAPSDLAAELFGRVSKEVRKTIRSVGGDAINPELRGVLNKVFGEQWMQETWAAATEQLFAKHDVARNAFLRLSDQAFNAESSQIPELLSERADILLDYAGRLNASAREVSNRRGEFDRSIVELAKYIAGTDDATQGLGLLAPLARSVRAVTGKPTQLEQFLWDMNRAWTKTFGVRGGAVSQVARQAIHASQDGYVRLLNDRISHAALATAQLMRDFGVPEKHLGETLDAVTALMVRNRMDAGKMWGTAAKFDEATGAFVEAEHPMVTALQRAHDLGMLNGQINPDWVAGLARLADEHVQLLDDLGEAAVGRGQLSGLKEGYVPNLLGEQGRQTFRTNERSFNRVNRGTAKTAKGIAPDPGVADFQKARTTDQYRFTGPDGRLHRFFEFQRALTQRPVDSLDPYEKAVAESIKTFDKMIADNGLSPEQARAAFSRPTDPFELNRIANEEPALRLFTGGEKIPLYATNAAILMGARYADQAKANAIQGLHEIMGQHGVDLAGVNVAATIKPGETVRLRDGGTATMLPVSGGQKMIDIGGIRYRALNQDLFKHSVLSLVDPASDPGIFERWYPERVAEAIERVHKPWANPNEWHALLKGWDKAVNIWKMATLTHPSWIIINGIGDMVLLAQSGLNPDKWVPKLRAVNRVLSAASREPDKLARVAIDIAGQTYTGEQFINLAQQERLFGNLYGQVAEARSRGLVLFPSETRRVGMFDVKGQAKKLRDIAREHYNGSLSMAEARAGAGGPAVGVGDTARAVASAVDETLIRRVWGTWFKANDSFHNAMRLSAFAGFMEEGMDVRAAAQAVRDAMFDYGDFTGTETVIRRFVFPFYSWLRNNSAYQIKMLIENPKSIAALPKLHQALEEAIDGNSRLPRDQRPEWMLERLAIQLGADPTTRQAVLGLNTLPQGDTIDLLSPLTSGAAGIQQLATYFGRSITPLVRLPFELAVHKEIATGRSIESDGTGDQTPAEYAMKQLRPFREAPVLSRAFQKSTGAGVSRLFLGGRIQEFSDTRVHQQKLHEFKTREESLRTAANRFQYKGDSAGSERARIQLMRLYEEMEHAGFGDEIPRWAKAQLVRLHNTTD